MSARVDLLEGTRIALYSLKANRMRTVLTTIGIGIGVATLLAIVGIIQGLNQSFDRQLASFGTNTLHVSKFPWMMKGGSWHEYRNRKNFTLADIDAIRAQSSYVTAISPTVMRPISVEAGGKELSTVRVVGARGEYLGIAGFETTQGRYLTDADDEVTRPVAVLGADVAAGLFPGVSPVGASVRIDDRPFRVVGVLSRKGNFLGDNQDLTVHVPFKSFRASFGSQRPMSLAIAVTSAADLNKAEDQLVGILRRMRNTPPEKPDDFAINRPEQLAKTYNEISGGLYAVAVGVGLITLLVGGIGIMNIMLVSVRERTREIGVRRALGARKRTIIVQFLLEAMAVSALGGLIGTLVGLGTAKVLSLVTPLAAAVQPGTILAGVGFAALVGLIFGIWPAARAANLDPVEALRYE